MTPIPITTRLPTRRETLNRCCWWGHQVPLGERRIWRWRWQWQAVGADTHWLPAGEVRLPSRVAPVAEA